MKIVGAREGESGGHLVVSQVKLKKDVVLFCRTRCPKNVLIVIPAGMDIIRRLLVFVQAIIVLQKNLSNKSGRLTLSHPKCAERRRKAHFC